MLIFTAVVVFDSTIVDFSSYSGAEPSISVNTAIFISFSIIFGATSTLLLTYVRKSTYASKSGGPRFGYAHWIISGTQILTVIIILAIILQIVLLNEYYLVLLKLQTYLTHISALGFLSLLVFLFARWFTSKKSYTIILYTISLSLVFLNLVVSLVYLETYLSGSEVPTIKPYPIHSYVTNFVGVQGAGWLGPLGALIAESLGMVFDVLSLCSFLLMWIATTILLRQYRYKMGRKKYFSLMIIPLLYYVFPFQNYFGDAFLSLLDSSPVFFSILYVLIFSASKQVGALAIRFSFLDCLLTGLRRTNS